MDYFCPYLSRLNISSNLNKTIWAVRHKTIHHDLLLYVLASIPTEASLHEVITQTVKTNSSGDTLDTVADLGGCPKFSQFHAVFRKIWQNFLNFMQFLQNLAKSYVGALWRAGAPS